ncbi:hypothetical protein ABBQ32_011617 [Trebouxia sp. C0010 RCD-2024]
MHRPSHPHNASRTQSAETTAEIPNKSQGSVSQQQTTNSDGQPEPGAAEQSQQTQQQYQEQQYSEAEWAAYWQYYETTEPQPEPAQPAAVQPAVSPSPDDTRGTLQARAQQVQGGNLTSLLMASFEAGYQTGRHEALLQKQ